jgi:carbonic anhydrase
MSVVDDVTAANEDYAREFRDKGDLGLPPARGFAILTCMDARLDPAKYAGLSEGDAHVIRNAGGRASDDAIRSLVISYKLLGTSEWFVIHHTDCGMEFFTNDVMAGLLDQSLDTAELGADGFRDVGAGPGSSAGHDIDWLTIADRTQSVVDERPAHPRAPTRPLADPGLRVRLRRPHRAPRGGPGRDRRWRCFLIHHRCSNRGRKLA